MENKTLLLDAARFTAFAFLVLIVNININTLNLLPAWLAWGLVLIALNYMKEHDKHYLRYVAVALGVIEMTAWINDNFTHYAVNQSVFHIVVRILEAYFYYFFFDMYATIAADEDETYSKKFKTVGNTALLLAVISIIITPLSLKTTGFQLAILVFLVAYLIYMIYIVVTLFKYYRLLKNKYLS